MVMLGLVIGFYLAPAATFAAITDAGITSAVEKQIFKDPGVTLNFIDVHTSDGIVTLSGTVRNMLARDRAVAVARTVKGVRSVVDKLSVKILGRTDTDIQQDIRTDVQVDNGVAVISGTVDSWAERDLVAKVIKGVRGVRGLINNIEVDYKAGRSDEEILEEVKRRLHWDALVDDSLVDVRVIDGTVIFTGTVGSAAELERAVRDARVAGVKSVDSRALEVKWWSHDDRLRRDKYVQPPDEEIIRAVKDAFLYDPRVSMFDISVTVDNGRVVLRGVVDNLKARRAAAKDARNTVGVRTVINHIKVRPGTPTDREIFNNIRDAFGMDPYLDPDAVKITVLNGDVYLNGTVKDFFAKARADYIVSGIYGVTEVYNRLKVEDRTEVLIFNPYVDDWYTYDYGWYTYPYYLPVKSDRYIKNSIEDEFFWSPFVDGEDVTVKVDDGVAVLTGTVDSWREYNSAVENALEGGAVMVDNELELATPGE